MQRMISHTEPLPNCRNGHPVPHALLQAPLPLSNVTHLRARP